jgi:signal peptidase
VTALTTPRRSRLALRLARPVAPTLRVARTVLRFLATTVTGFVIGIALALALPLAFDARPLVVLSGSMEPVLGTGDVSVVRSIAPLDARPGDIVTFRDPANAERLITHRVRAMHVQGDAVVFRTRGDVNNVSERWRVAADGEIGRLMYRIPMLGWVLNYARSKGLFVLLLGGALALLLVLELTAIWRTEEEGDSDPVA